VHLVLVLGLVVVIGAGSMSWTSARGYGGWFAGGRHGTTDHHDGGQAAGREACAGWATTTTSTPPTEPSTVVAPGSLTQTIVVSVPPVVRVTLRSDGSMEMLTNAGHAPRPSDHVLIRTQDEATYDQADDLTRARVLSAKWTDDDGEVQRRGDASWCDTVAVHHSARRGHGRR
jgi:hypothetical protein